MGRTIPFFLTANHCKNGLGDAIGYATLLYYIPVIPCFAGEQSRGELSSYFDCGKSRFSLYFNSHYLNKSVMVSWQ